MAQKTISAEQLTEGRTVHIRGELGFSRITSLIEGEELQRSIARQKQGRRRYITDKPHVAVRLSHAQVVVPEGREPTTEETYVAERCFTADQYPESGTNYSIESKGNGLNLPIIALQSETEPGKYEQDTSGRELAPGLDVTLVLEVYKAGDQLNRGLSIQQVIVNEPVRYFSAGGVDTEELKARGIEFTSTPQVINPSQASTSGPVPEESGEEALPAPQPSARPTAAPPAWAQQPAASQPSAPATPTQEESVEEKLARLEKLEAQQAQLQGQNAGSAVGPAQDNPWGEDASTQAGITYAAS